jgi:misacylated tRNA(Ala) deacylase
MPAEALFRTDAYIKTCAATVTFSGPDGVRLDRSIFYPTGGGQPGDTGHMTWMAGEGEHGKAAIIDTRKYRAEGEHDDILHILAEGHTPPAPGTTVELTLDWDRRYAHMRMHSCMHLLSALLREGAVTGGQVGAEKSRLDFDLPSGVIDKDQLTFELNRLITENHEVSERWITDEELLAQPELVRTMSVKPPMGHGKVRLLVIGSDVDLQPCGGTHIRLTGEIGPVEVAKIENKGKQNRHVTVIFRTA